jgi:hypothetical protein
VTWHVLAGNVSGEWHPLWLNLLAQIAPALPKSTQVLLLFDRGLYSKRLFNVVRAYGWHPFMRIREQGLYKRPNSKNWQDLKHLTYRGMSPQSLRVHCFKGDTLQAYLWVEWTVQQQEACLLLTDLKPKQVKGNPYPLRMWIEAGFKDCKRGGLHLEQSKILDPDRLQRLIFVLAVALFYLIRFGSGLWLPSIPTSDPARRLSLVTLGYLALLVASIQDKPLITVAFQPYLLPAFYLPQKTYP